MQTTPENASETEVQQEVVQFVHFTGITGMPIIAETVKY
jgi:hypothetical protein